jgi:hypothetical protein
MLEVVRTCGVMIAAAAMLLAIGDWFVGELAALALAAGVILSVLSTNRRRRSLPSCVPPYEPPQAPRAMRRAA